MKNIYNFLEYRASLKIWLLMFFREIIHLRQRPETEKRVRLLGFRDFPIGFPWWLRWQRICLQCKRSGFHSSVRKIPWRREWLPTPIFLPGKFHGQRSLVGYSPWDHKNSNMTEWPTLKEMQEMKAERKPLFLSKDIIKVNFRWQRETSSEIMKIITKYHDGVNLNLFWTRV